ncbi:PIN domain-containing protein [Chloracidobacterium thermophilum]|uniref:hypothetical protein n=1 Tax=Chloracidobacterium thermophilum TaxID=458033 RepID=UPI001BB2D15F|nr:hypothetical protein [Chloracidobacterium thermophilum]QUV80463.1 hypothetical protein J8C08_12735 [Chloracidobacterium thermophilum]
MPKRTYVDTSVLVAAFKGQGEIGQRALSVLDDPERTLVVSDAVRLEALPMAHYHRQPQEAAFYEAVFSLPMTATVLVASGTSADAPGDTQVVHLCQPP